MVEAVPPETSQQRKEAMHAAALGSVELAGIAVGVPHIAALKALIAGPSSDSLVSLVNQVEGFSATQPQSAFGQLSQGLTTVPDITAPAQRVAQTSLELVPRPDQPKQPASEARPVPQPQRTMEQSQLLVIKQEFERIGQQLGEIGDRVGDVTRQIVLESQLNSSEEVVQAARVRLRKLMPEQLTSIIRIFARVVQDLYAQDVPQYESVQEKLQQQYRQIAETHALLVLAFDELEKKFAEARRI